MLVKTAFALSVAALATAAPLQESRRSIDLSQRDLVNTQVGATAGKNSGAYLGAVVGNSGDVDVATDVRLGHLLGLDANASLGLGKLLKGLLGGLVKRDNIVDTNVGASLGKHSGANVAATVGSTGDINADVDAKLGHLLGLDANVSLGLGRLLKGLLGGLLKRDLSSEELYKRANDDLVDVGLASQIGKNSHANAAATVGSNLDTQVDVDSKIGHLLGLKLDAGVSISNLLRGLLNVHHKRSDDVVVATDLDIAHLIASNIDIRLGLAQLLNSLIHVDIKTKRSEIDSNTYASVDSNGIVAATQASVGSAVDATAAAVVNAQGVAASVEGNVGNIVTDTKATLTKEGLNAGSYVATDKSVVGAGLLSGKDGINAGAVAQLGSLLGVQVDAKTTPILRGLLRGLLSKN
ncbi:hypothetical protein JCM11491_006198 [Sporobolomyces phaffii]